MRFADKHAKRDKGLLRLDRELRRLYHAQWNAPIIPLEHPYQRGWIKFYVVRKDALHHPKAEVFKAVLTEVNQHVHSLNREFVRRNGDSIVLRPDIVPVWRWNRLKWPASHQHLFALGTWPVENQFPLKPRRFRHQVYGFKLMSTWWLEESIQPFMITHQKVDLPDVRSRIAWIEAHFENQCGRQRLCWLRGSRFNWIHGPDRPSELRAIDAFTQQCE